MRYQVPFDQSEFLSNKLGLTDATEIAVAEFQGFLQAELSLTTELTANTKFDSKYLQKIHRLALSEMYDFAGKWRTVNLSKGGFLFASAQFLPQIMHQFENDFLRQFPKNSDSRSSLIDQVAQSHAEILLIHPFREGNGRTSRILANLMFRKHGIETPDWTQIDQKRFSEYILAVQQAANNNYQPMINLVSQIF